MKLTAMQIAESKKCKTPEEVVEKAKERGIEITLEEAKEVLAAPAIVELDEDELDTVSGGTGCDTEYLPSVSCGYCSNTANYSFTTPGGTIHKYLCSNCGCYTVYEGKKYVNYYDPNDDE